MSDKMLDFVMFWKCLLYIPVQYTIIAVQALDDYNGHRISSALDWLAGQTVQETAR